MTRYHQWQVVLTTWYDAEMDTSDSRCRVTWLCVVAVLLILLLYSLSVGPACVLSIRTGAPDRCYAVYLPLIWICETIGSVEILNEYVGWWLDVTATPWPPID